MTRNSALFALAWLAFGAAACANITSAASPDANDVAAASDSKAGECTACVIDEDCPGGRCARIGGQSWCAAPCQTGAPCPAGTTCTAAQAPDGSALQVCVPNPCNVAAASTETSLCPGYSPPTTADCCHCTGKNCTPNGCYGGWYCQTQGCQCRPPSDAESCGPTPGAEALGDIVINPTGGDLDGGTVDTLAFAIVGDTRPPFKDATETYPTAIITAIWQQVAAAKPALPLAVTTGDYVFASPNGIHGAKQLDLYLQAQKAFAGPVLHAMGNHECTGYTASNCGEGLSDGVTGLYLTYLDKMVKQPLGLKRPFFSYWVRGKTGGWTAKFVVVAPNAWTKQQAAWLEAELSKPTNYTFVLRHEPSYSTTAPGLLPSQTIVNKHPLTMLLAGHSHTYSRDLYKRELVVGNGGAPLTSDVPYGYVSARQQSNGNIKFEAIDYQTGAAFDTFAVDAAGQVVK
ncbi:MAG: metallophosphoesterase [Deltaproteobacteria bacterium]|nr:metallophosphoesterase [Deltaproteobacteria bacterium]